MHDGTSMHFLYRANATLHVATQLLTFLQFLIPDGGDGFCVLSVVDGPLSHDLDVLQRGTQVLKLPLQSLLREAVRSSSMRRRHFYFQFLRGAACC